MVPGSVTPSRAAQHAHRIDQAPSSGGHAWHQGSRPHHDQRVQAQQDAQAVALAQKDPGARRVHRHGALHVELVQRARQDAGHHARGERHERLPRLDVAEAPHLPPRALARSTQPPAGTSCRASKVVPSRQTSADRRATEHKHTPCGITGMPAGQQVCTAWEIRAPALACAARAARAPAQQRQTPALPAAVPAGMQATQPAC